MARRRVDEQATAQPVGMFIGTPEIYFAKRIDNSRVLKVVDPKRRRELALFAVTLSILLMFVMVYVWQHFSAIEYGYKIEQLKSEREAIMETNRSLNLEESSLRDLSRIDHWPGRWVYSLRRRDSGNRWSECSAIPARR